MIFENAGHIPPRIDVIREVNDWLDRYLGPAARGTVTTDTVIRFLAISL